MAKSKLRQLVRFPLAADSCPWVGKLRTVLPLKNRVIRDSAVQLGLTHQRGANGVDSRGEVSGRAWGSFTYLLGCMWVRLVNRFNHTVLFHPTALHAPAVGLNTANSAIWNLINNGTGSISVNNHPMDDPTTSASKGTDVQVGRASLYTIVVRTHVYDAAVWDLSLVQGPFSVTPCQTR
jgi:hypothetical protein